MAGKAPPGTLQAVYGPASTAETRDYYESWAGEYEADTIGQGFRVPYLGAALFARYAAHDVGPVLDAACGTGVVGDALALLGYGPIEGIDLSPAMLRQAAARGAYRTVSEGDLTALPHPDGAFGGTMCIGAFGPGHAPPEALDELARVTAPGGHLVFNVRADTWEEQGFAAKIEAMAAAGRWTEVERTPAFPVYLLNDLPLAAILFAVRIG